ncbi:hypothetical protein ACTWP6_10440 [Mycobacterium sp. 4D054]|uniref:hypothetical protein n=1 Tax=unclassified Mycobacterium TaxID=2642494 RepID=UPI0021B35FCA|nr:hypothetical protein [Mycobacterium sp. SMC-8]UXA14824.1 hypothetical protein KXD97_14300 [Mycobacterium sp. SMC-8]
MARAAHRVPRAGLYADLAERERRAMATGGTVVNTTTGTAYTAHPARVAAFRAGAPVSLPASAIPETARHGIECRWWTRAIVHPDGTVDFLDDPAAWLAEAEL